MMKLYFVVGSQNHNVSKATDLICSETDKSHIRSCVHSVTFDDKNNTNCSITVSNSDWQVCR